MLVLLLVAMTAMATGEFSTGGAELLTFKGYLISNFNIYGEEDAQPGTDFDIIAAIEWLPRLNDFVDAKIAFKSDPAKYTGTYRDLSLRTEDVMINMNFSDAVTFSMGQFKRPFGYNYTISGSGLYFRDRALVAGILGPFGNRSMGANLGIDLGMVDFDLAYTNSSGGNRPEEDSKKNFNARAVISPMEGIAIAGAFGSYSMYTDSTMEDSWSATGMDVYATADFPLSETSALHFSGEYLMIGQAMDDDVDWTDTNGYALTLMANFKLDGDVFKAVRPAVRFENVSPGFAGDDDPENDFGAIDFCLNMDVYSSRNTAQIGMRNYSFQNEDMDGYTDMYVGWRMRF
jgi:hypothetical protein